MPWANKVQGYSFIDSYFKIYLRYCLTDIEMNLTAVLKVETDIITSITASPIRGAYDV